MLEAIHTGLLYGMIAGTSVFGFLLTCIALWGIIEGLDRIIDFATGGDKYGGTKRTRDDY